MRKHFIMFEHITPMNVEVVRNLNGDERIDSAWYYNDKIFVTDQRGIRHQFHIMNTVVKKLNS